MSKFDEPSAVRTRNVAPPRHCLTFYIKKNLVKEGDRKKGRTMSPKPIKRGRIQNVRQSIIGARKERQGCANPCQDKFLWKETEEHSTIVSERKNLLLDRGKHEMSCGSLRGRGRSSPAWAVTSTMDPSSWDLRRNQVG